jgi:ABC-type nitrate/sulfonate/bicarbonate transport system substrate-binding protein
MIYCVCVFAAALLAAVPERAPVTIEVPSKTNLQFFTLWVALGSGFFQEAGLEPRLLADDTPRNSGQYLLKGEADVALLPPPMFLGRIAEMEPIVLFASLLANEPINLVVRKELAEERKISLRASLRERLQGLKGLRIGVAGEPPPRLRALFASVGMNADQDIQIVIVDGPDQVQAFADGKIDGLFAHTPYLETVLVNHQAVLIADTSAGEVPLLTDGQIHALVTTPENVLKKREVVAAVTRAVYRAQKLIHSDQKATVNAILASGATQADRSLVEAIVAIYSPAVPQTPKISLTGMERDTTLYPAHPRVPDFTRVKAADYVAPQFADEAIKAKP